MYAYLQAAMESLVNNFQIDLKFFNTYGPARHFYYYSNDLEREELMDRVCKDLEYVPFNKKEIILDELLKTDIYKSISDKKDEIIGRIGVNV